MDEDNLRSQFSNLPLYAEAAPEVFLEALEADIGRPESAVRTLMAPVSDDFFGRTDRVDLLWALELLAWRPEWLHRVVDLLANLAKMEPDDNLFDKPSESLKSIFRAWMPQTTADIKLRVAALEHLIKKHPEIAWRIAAAQFDPAQRTGGYTRKPIWRDYAVGHGEPAINERRAFVTRCIETCLQWPRHTRDTLADLIQSALSETWFLLTHLDKLGEAVIEWAGSASDEDRAWLCQRLRASLRWNLSRRFNGSKSEPNQDQLVSKAKRMLQSLEPDDPVWRHAWLFENEQVEGWHEELEEGGDYKARYKQIEAQRRKTTQEVWTASGENGVIRLAFTGNAPNVAGRSLAQVIKDQDKRVAFIAAVLRDGDALKSHRHRQLLTGFFHGVGAATTFSLVELRCSGHLDDAGVMLLCLAPFVREVWDRINAISETAANQYWAKVEPFQVCQSKEDHNYAVAQLLEAERAAAAWILGCVEWAHLESRHIFKILLNVRTASDYEQGWDKVGAYRVKSALEVLAKRRAVHQEELARLEFLYLDLLWIDDKGVPNLEREIETKPEMFCEAVMLAYRREDNDAQTERTERERNQADRASLLLRTLARIPGHDENGELCKDRLTKWIRRAQELCEANGRRRTGNHHIGQLLSNAPVGEDGVWPCEIVRSVLNDVMNEDIEKGFWIARMNSPHFKLRGKGGAQERELAEQYEEWAKAADYSHPKVATFLRKLASSYRKEGRHQDLEDNYRNRLGY